MPLGVCQALVPMTSFHVKRLEITELKMCRWAYGHTQSPTPHLRNNNTLNRETLEIEPDRKGRTEGQRGCGHVHLRTRPKQIKMDCVNRH